MESPLQFCYVHTLHYQLEIGPLLGKKKLAWESPRETDLEGEDAQTKTPENYEKGSNPVHSPLGQSDARAEKSKNATNVQTW